MIDLCVEIICGAKIAESRKEKAERAALVVEKCRTGLLAFRTTVYV